jgi:uncharacterized protein YutE (UPF0331/DUF86 family)
MKPLDPERMEKLISSMRGALKLLGELRDLTDAEFMSDPHKQSSAKYNFTAAIEAAIDIASHVISRKALRAPEDYADTFQVLSDSGIVSSDFADELKKMARFRNRLVHLYWDVDTAELRRILETKLGDFDRYLSEIGAYMTREEA